MKKIIFILAIALTFVSCQKEEIIPNNVESERTSFTIRMNQVTPDNAMDYIDQFGCKELPDLIDQWDWESVHHADNPISILDNQGLLQTIEFTADSCFYPNLTGGMYEYFSTNWTHLDCSVIRKYGNESQDLWVHVSGDNMIMIGTSDLTVWRLSRH